MEGSTCATCRFYQSIRNWSESQAAGGECRYNPPEQFPMPHGEFYSRWPDVSPECWCGEWELKHD